MSRIQWHDQEPRTSLGVSHGVVYFHDRSALPWNGLVEAVEAEAVEDDDPTYLDGERLVATGKRLDEFSINIEAFTKPPLSAGKVRGISYRSYLGETEEVHLVYNTSFVFDETPYMSMGGDLELSTISAFVNTAPEALSQLAPSAHAVFVMKESGSSLFQQALDEMLYGEDAYLPPLDDLIDWFLDTADETTLLIVDHHDGRWTAIGLNDDVVYALSPTEYAIDDTSVTYVDSDTYVIASY